MVGVGHVPRSLVCRHDRVCITFYELVTLFFALTDSFCLRSFLAKRGVKEEILGFDVRSVTPEIRQSVQELLVKNQSSFDVKVGRSFDSGKSIGRTLSGPAQ